MLNNLFGEGGALNPMTAFNAMTNDFGTFFSNIFGGIANGLTGGILGTGSGSGALLGGSIGSMLPLLLLMKGGNGGMSKTLLMLMLLGGGLGAGLGSLFSTPSTATSSAPANPTSGLLAQFTGMFNELADKLGLNGTSSMPKVTASPAVIERVVEDIPNGALLPTDTPNSSIPLPSDPNQMWTYNPATPDTYVMQSEPWNTNSVPGYWGL